MTLEINIFSQVRSKISKKSEISFPARMILAAISRKCDHGFTGRLYYCDRFSDRPHPNSLIAIVVFDI